MLRGRRDVVAMLRDRGGNRVRPKSQVGFPAFAALQRDGVGDIEKVGALFDQLRPCGRHRGIVGRRLRQRSGDYSERILKLSWRRSLGARARAEPRRLLPQKLDHVADAGAQRGRCRPGAAPFAAGVGERDQMTGEIAAVYRGHVRRRQNGEIARAVPIEEMPAIARHSRHRRERRLQPRDRLIGADPAKIPRRDDGEQVQTDIGRRRPVRDDGGGGLLIIVRRQIVFRGRDKSLEISPGPARSQPKRH